MKKEYDFSSSVKNPYSKFNKRSVTKQIEQRAGIEKCAAELENEKIPNIVYRDLKKLS